MINITKQGNNVIVTSDNPNSFHIGNGELSVPLNTIYYVLDDESDFIQFNSTEEGNILFNGTIGQIQVNGNIVNRENILMELDNVFNSAATGGEGGTAGVLSINGYDGYINLKSINGQSLIGSGDIEISGGEGGTAGVNKIIMGDEDYGWNALSGDIKLTNGWMDLDDDGVQETYDIRVGDNETSSLWFGFNSTDNSIKIEDNGSRLSFTVNPDILGGGGGSSAGVEAINIGQDIQDWTQKTGVVRFNTSFYDGSYDVNINSTSFYGLKPIDDSIVLENAGYTVNGNFRCGIKVNEDNFKTINGESIFGTGDITIEGGSDLISINANNSSDSLNVGSGNTGDLYGTILVGRNIVNKYNAAVLIGNGVTNTVGDRNNMAVNICNSLMADSNGNMYFWKNGKVEKLADYAVYKEWSGTQAEYDALGTYDDNTIYNIIEG